jgi:hypothetical protein
MERVRAVNPPITGRFSGNSGMRRPIRIETSAPPRFGHVPYDMVPKVAFAPDPSK